MEKKALKEIRLDKGLRQRDIADMARICRSYYSLLENGKRTPSIEIAAEVSTALNISLEELVDALLTMKEKELKGEWKNGYSQMD